MEQVAVAASALAARSHRRRETRVASSQAANLFEAEQARLRQRAAGLLPAEADELAGHDEREDECELELPPDLVRDVPAVHLFYLCTGCSPKALLGLEAVSVATTFVAATQRMKEVLEQYAGFELTAQPPSTYEPIAKLCAGWSSRPAVHSPS